MRWGAQSRPRTKPMRSGRLGRCLIRPSVLLAALGLVLGFATTMCIQSLTCISNQPQPTPRNCATTQRAVAPTPLPSPVLPSPAIPNRKLILVGVMTAQKYVDTRAYAVWRTWAKTIPGQVLFFVAENTRTQHNDMPIVRLAGVDDTYPPQKKAFMMLKWMADNALDQYQWFLRADDDLYARGDKLEVFLRSLDSERPLFIGQAGQGTAEEYGQLSLADNENYCMGGPGVVLSHQTLRLLRPHLSDCLSHMYTTHEDVEVGRCVRKYVGVACTWSYEMQTIFHNNQSGAEAYAGDLNVPEVHQAISMHPVKRPSVMLRLHNYVRGLKTADLRFRSVQLSRDVLLSLQQLRRLNKAPNGAAEWTRYVDSGAPPSLLNFWPVAHSELLPWDFVSSSNVLYCSDELNCPRHSVPSYQKYATNNAIRQMFDFFNRNARQRGRLLKYQSMQYAYVRVDPMHGAHYIMDMILLFQKFRGRRATIPVRRHAYLQHSFGSLEAIDERSWRLIERQRSSASSSSAAPLPSLIPDRLHLIVPLAGRINTLERFVHNFESVIESGQMLDVSLLVVLFKAESGSENAQILAILQQLQEKHSNQLVRWVEIPDRPFSRGVALARGASAAPSDQSLLFFTDVDILFTADALYRVRQNTVAGRQVYFPIVFSEFAPETWPEEQKESRSQHFQHSTQRGYFRHFGFGLVSLYRGDLDAVGGLDTHIEGWGLEDVDLFEKCLRHHNLVVFRAPDPGLVHVYHPVHCARSMPPAQYNMCIGSKAQSYASSDTLAEELYARMSDHSP